nr:zinc ribbon domain-containing protein [uncultured Lachnoanaerobaculum sp.]
MKKSKNYQKIISQLENLYVHVSEMAKDGGDEIWSKDKKALQEAIGIIDDYEKATEQAALLVQRYEVGAKVIHRDMDIYVCPNCGRRAKLNHAYCHRCGKKLLWNSIPASQQKVKKKK